MFWHETMRYVRGEEHRMLIREPVSTRPAANAAFIYARGDHSRSQQPRIQADW
jgi:hypothetical protein